MVSKEVGGLIEDDTHQVGSLASTYVHKPAWTPACICVPACAQAHTCIKWSLFNTEYFLSKHHCFTFFVRFMQKSMLNKYSTHCCYFNYSNDFYHVCTDSVINFFFTFGEKQRLQAPPQPWPTAAGWLYSTRMGSGFSTRLGMSPHKVGLYSPREDLEILLCVWGGTRFTQWWFCLWECCPECSWSCLIDSWLTGLHVFKLPTKKASPTNANTFFLVKN